MVLLLCKQNSLVPGSDGQKGTHFSEKIASGAPTPRSSSPIPTLERRVRLEEEVWATLTSNSRKGYSTEVPNAARHQPASLHNKRTTNTDCTHTTHTQIAHTRRTQIAHTRTSESNKDKEDVPLNSLGTHSLANLKRTKEDVLLIKGLLKKIKGIGAQQPTLHAHNS